MVTNTQSAMPTNRNNVMCTLKKKYTALACHTKNKYRDRRAGAAAGQLDQLSGVGNSKARNMKYFMVCEGSIAKRSACPKIYSDEAEAGLADIDSEEAVGS